MENSKCCIFMISSRVKVLKTCLELLYKNYNNKFQFPVHIFYFDDIYSNDYIEDIQNSINKNINFHQIEYKIPDHIEEKDLFYNKTFLKYVRHNFSKKRIGYLHAVYWKYNCFTSDILKQYDYLHIIDDDSFFIKEINNNLFDLLEGFLMGTSHTEDYVNRNIIDVRQELHTFIKYFINKYNITIKNKELKECINNDDTSYIYGNKNKKTFIKWNSGNCNMYNRKLFDENWKLWIKEINNFGGTFKHRWTDIEVITLYCYIFLDKPCFDFKLKEKGLYETGNTKWLRVGTAPSTKN